MKTYQINNRRYFIGALVSVLIGTMFGVVLQFFKGKVLDCAAAGNVQNTISYTGLLLGFIICEVLGYFLYDWFRAKFVAGCTRQLKQDIFTSIVNRGYVAYKERPQGEYLAKYTSEADLIKERRFKMLPMLWEILFKIMLVSGALFFLDWRVAIVTITLLTTPLYVPKLIEKRLQTAQAAYLQSVEDNLSKVSDWLSGFEIIKNYSIEQKILGKFSAVNDDTTEKLLKDAQLGNLSGLITTLISYLSYFIVLVLSAWLVLQGVFSVGDFFVAIGMIDQLSYPLISLAGIIRQLIAVKPACKDMAAFVKTSEATQTAVLTEVRKEIRFRNVTFSYDGKRLVLDRFSFQIKKGNRYLLQGPSGCGKTTAVNLLLRYYDAQSGSITIDGQPIETYGSTYGCMTVVRQEAILFHDTLRNNLTMFQHMPDGKLLTVLNNVGLEQYANAEALDTILAEQGANLSGGEKKRICLARALLRDTEVLILDEPLANLDETTAAKIEDLLLSIEGKTMLIVSHQFSESKLAAFDQVLNFTGKTE